MQAYLCAAIICAVIFVSANAFAAEIVVSDRAYDRAYDVVELTMASIAIGLLINPAIEMWHGLPKAEFLSQDSALEVAGV